MYSASIAQALVGWFLLLEQLPETAAAEGAAHKKHGVVSDDSSPAMASTTALAYTERKVTKHITGSATPQDGSAASNSDDGILLRASEDATSDHCITSADCAFNGECAKQSDDESRTHHDGRKDNINNVNNISNNRKNNSNKKIDPEAPGHCACFAGWKGRTCEVLDLLPVDPQKVGLVLPNRDSSTWGGSVVYHEADGVGLYHMFASEILYNCGLYSWTTNSQVRAICDLLYSIVLCSVYYVVCMCQICC
jgi:hypothetical protein